MTKIVLVNENDEIIGSKEREEITKDDINRVSALWIRSLDGKVLLAKRSFTKKYDAGKWGPAVTGTVDDGESYQDNIKKEANEELGISGLSLIMGPKLKVNNSNKLFCQWFVTMISKDIEFKLQKEEVEEVRWFDKDKLRSMLKSHPEEFTKSINSYIKMFI